MTSPDEILRAFGDGRMSLSELKNVLVDLKNRQRCALSESQKGLWLIQKNYPHSCAYNVPICFKATDLDVAAFRRAVAFVLEQYPDLRSRVLQDGGEPFRQIDRNPEDLLRFIELRRQGQQDVHQLLRAKVREPFDLEKEGVLRICICDAGAEGTFVLIAFHHIAMDGISSAVFLERLYRAYADYRAGTVPLIDRRAEGFDSYVREEQELLASDEGKKRLAYWRADLKGELTPAGLLPGTGRSQPESPLSRGATLSVVLPAASTERIRRHIKNERVYLSTFLLAVFKLLLHKYTDDQDILVALPVNARTGEKYDAALGHFVYLIIVRSFLDDQRPFSGYLSTLQKKLIEGVRHAYPYPRLVKELGLSTRDGAYPMAHATFAHHDFLSRLGVVGDDWQIIDEIQQEGEFELFLETVSRSGRIELHWKYDPGRFDEQTIARMHERYVHLMEAVTSRPDSPLSEFSLLTEREAAILLRDWNDTEEAFPTGRCLHDIFDERALANPDRIAVHDAGKAYNYRDLQQRADSLASYLREGNADPDRLVALLLDRSLYMVVAILGVLKTGAAYVPLDPEQPLDRLAAILEDTGASTILTQHEYHDKARALMKHVSRRGEIDEERAVAVVERVIERAEQGARSLPAPRGGSSRAAYVLYTSGTTGRPKGIRVTHAGILSTLNFLEKRFPAGQGDTWLLKTHYTFDVSISELFGWLVGTGRLAILPPGQEKEPDKIISFIERHDVTHVNFVPSMLGAFLAVAETKAKFLETCPLKYVLVAGEAFPPASAAKAVQLFRHAKVVNIYGPTEACIYATYYDCSSLDPGSATTPIGVPLSNAKAYIVDRRLRLQPIDLPGELCIGGAGLAEGYMNLPELTAERFIDNPFATQQAIAAGKNRRLYRTGDICRWRADGNIEYLGRRDDQVKLRGYRLELREIEAHLSRVPGVAQCAVVVSERQGHGALVAYYCASSRGAGTSAPGSSRELRAYLEGKLPKYAVPEIYVRLSEMPITPSGKVDRRALARRDRPSTSSTSASQSSELEPALLQIWREALSNDALQPTDNFLEAGGDSISAVILAQKMSDRFSLSLGGSILFRYPNVRLLSRYIEQQLSPGASPGEQDAQDRRDASVEAGGSERAESGALPDYYESCVAIIGISCNFPGSDGHEKFWENLRGGKECARFRTDSELREASAPEELIGHPQFVPVELSIEGKYAFDADFFHLSDKSAALMDPQFRLLLSHSWLALEDAGYVPADVRNTSVFMSASNHRAPDVARASGNAADDPDEYLGWIMSQQGSIPTMISYQLDLRSASVFVHSNCSSSLAALALAHQNLLLNECEYALVGAANALPCSKLGYIHQPGLNFSSDGHCRTFDSEADGMVGGEGVAVILLKRAVAAIKDGDHIYALLRGISVNNDGSRKAGFYAPGAGGQAAVIENVLARAGVDPDSIGYVEAHGTGTRLGDPIELQSLSAVYGKRTSRKQFCAIGSVKPNIGHLDTAAGIAGVIKIALSLRHGEIAPSINYKRPNPEIDFENSPFYVADALLAWPSDQTPRRAAVSSFGIGGTNVHGIFEEYREPDRPQAAEELDREWAPYLVPLSARTEERLIAYARKVLAFLHRQSDAETGLDHVSYTMQLGRVPMECRVVFVVRTLQELREAMAAFVEGAPGGVRWFRGMVPKRDDTFELLGDDDDTQELIGKWLARGQVEKVAAAWVKGVPVRWSLLPRRPGARRMSLPTYPFADTRVSANTDPGRTNERTQSSYLVPLWSAWSGRLDGGIPQTDASTLLIGASERDLEVIRRLYPRVTVLNRDADADEPVRVFDSVGRSLEQLIIIPRHVPLDPSMGTLIHDQQSAVLEIFDVARNLLDRGYGRQSLYWTILTRDTYEVVDEDGVNPVHASIGGLVGVLAKEYPNWRFRLIDAKSGGDLPLEQACRVPFDPDGNAWANRRGRWFKQELIPLDYAADHSAPLYQRGGVYLVIGGAGGIGEVFSRWLIKKFDAKLIWIGRREKDAAIQAKIERLSKLGAPPIYFQADATSQVALEDALARAKQVYSRINGAVIATIVLADASFANMTRRRFLAGVQAKVDVSVVAARVLERENLDFLLFFSSLTAFVKGAGQSNYAAGCTFTDALARYLAQSRPCKVKVMNWGYWGSVGIARDPGTQAYMRQTGMGSIEPVEGMRALDLLCSSPFMQLAYLQTVGADALSSILGGYIAANERVVCYPATVPRQPPGSIFDHVDVGERESRTIIEKVTGHVGEIEQLIYRMLLEYVAPFLSGRSHLQAKYDRWMRASTELLLGKGLLKKTATGTVPATNHDDGIDRLWALWQEGRKRWDQDESTRNQIVLAERCLRALPDILTGRVDATSVMFPGGSLELVEPLYKGDARARAFNQIVERIVTRYIDQRMERGLAAKIRILEIGAGTGGTTSGVISELRDREAHIEEYLYTDVSEAFLTHARRHYEPLAPYLKTAVLNIEHPITAQGISADAYDIVIATNVIHATRNIHESIRHCKSALHKGGVLVLNEISARSAYGHVTFGLLEGWWRYEDDELRISGTPLVHPATWHQVLREEGFESISAPAARLDELGQQIIVGVSSGVVRLPSRVEESASTTRSRAEGAEHLVEGARRDTPPWPGGASESADRERVEAMIVATLAKCLNRPAEKISRDTSFSDYGLDSILSIAFLKKINETLGLTLSVAVIYEFPSVSRLAGHLVTVCREAKGTLAHLGGSLERSGEGPRLIEQSVRRAEAARADEIAVVGMAGQFPGASDVETFWKNLVAGRDCVDVLPEDWLARIDTGSTGSSACRWGGLLEEKELFDPLFFKISPVEAESMSYHQRLVLQESWKALEDAGYNPKSLADSQVGVFIGAEPAGYPAKSFTGGSDAIIASRLSYFLDLKGPTLVVNTGCSSSGTAIHLACESLRHHESDMALAGGVFASMRPEILTSLSEIGIPSSTGRCRTFDAACDGTIISEGVGIVVLKRKEQAVVDGDHIYGVIVASGINQDGASNGITAPNGGAQIRLMADVYDRFHIDPQNISYVEAHGTGTKLGDPVEANALVRAFRKYTDRQHFCGIGSVKAHIGHTAAAAAVVGLIKVLLSIKHRTLPGLLHFERLNPLIELEGSPFYIQRETSEWRSRDDKPLMAALSSFGHSGTNVHLVIEEYVPSELPLAGPTGKAHAIVPISARNRAALLASAENLSRFVKAGIAGAGIDPRFTLANLAFTLQVGRESMEERAAFVVSDLDDLVLALDSFVHGVMPRNSWCGRKPRHEEQASVVALDVEQFAGGSSLDLASSMRIAESWASGMEVDWKRMHDGMRRQRIALPTYVFAKERYSPQAPQSSSEASARSTATGTGALRHSAAGNEQKDDRGSVLLFRKAWRRGASGRRVSGAGECLVLLCGMEPKLADIAKSRPDITVMSLSSNASSLAEQYTDYGVQLLDMARELLKSARDVSIQFVVPSEAPSSVHAGLSAFLRSATLENPGFRARTIAVPRQWTAAKLLSAIDESRSAVERDIRYEDDAPMVPYFEELGPMQSDSLPLPWKAHGVYVITGGLGGLGLVLARQIARSANGATLVLVGRKELDRRQHAAIEELQKCGATVLYRRADVADANEAQQMIDGILDTRGCINGIVHAAGVIRDNYIIRKSTDELTDVFAPKVTGLVNLDQATARVRLDFMVLYSSGAGALGSPGQADYSAANAFMDEFAEYRNRLVSVGRRCGHTVAIDWGLWEEGGMRVDSLARSTWREVAGMLPMETESGLPALYQALYSGASQVMVIAGIADKIRQNVAAAHEGLAPDAGRVEVRPSDDPELKARTLQKVLQLFGSVIKMPVERLDENEPLENYGLDSILVARLNREFGAVFANLSKTLFYEYPALRKIAEHLVAKHSEECRAWIGLAERADPIDGARREGAATRSARAGPAQPEEPIAIIGITGRYPKADTLDEFWSNLQQAKDCITAVSPLRWPMQDAYRPEVEEAIRLGKSYSRWGGFLEGFADFDAAFFNMSPREAMATDPQERLFLQASWSLLEDAGYTRHRLEQEYGGDVGVFVGVTQTAFNLYGPAQKERGEVVAHSSLSSIANRVSYFFNFNGPSIPVDTMCSSSLTALHLACESLRNGSCRMAIAGGVNVYTHPWTYATLCALRMLSVDGKCRSFGKGANGFVPGEGVGAFLLKRLSCAIEDNDNIHAVIRGSHVNHGGKTNGYTVPSPKAQSRVISAALRRAGIDPAMVTCVEAHGTGTDLGDPIEINGLTEAFREGTQDSGFSAVGSVKSNIGHLEAAAGIASATKVVLQLKHATLVPSLNAEELNPNIDFEHSPFFVNRKLSRWETPLREEQRIARIAGVSSFGAGGSNAHMLFEEYSAPDVGERPHAHVPVVAFVLSAKNDERLIEYAQSLLRYTAARLGFVTRNFVNLAHTFQVGREPMEARLAFAMSSVNDLERHLRAFIEKRPQQGLHHGNCSKRGDCRNGRVGELVEKIAARPSQEDYDELLRLWVKGAEVDWLRLYPEGRPDVVSAPTYPFAKVAYWFDSPRTTGRGVPLGEPDADFDVEYYSRLIDEAIGAA